MRWRLALKGAARQENCAAAVAPRRGRTGLGELSLGSLTPTSSLPLSNLVPHFVPPPLKVSFFSNFYYPGAPPAAGSLSSNNVPKTDVLCAHQQLFVSLPATPFRKLCPLRKRSQDVCARVNLAQNSHNLPQQLQAVASDLRQLALDLM